jgi:hypothetical protein
MFVASAFRRKFDSPDTFRLKADATSQVRYLSSIRYGRLEYPDPPQHQIDKPERQREGD